MDSPKILLLTHGGWGMSLVESLKMIIGSVDFVHEIPLTPEATFAEYYNSVKEYAESMPKDSLILTDVFGGTTTNVAAKIGRDLQLKVISGLNAPMMMDACTQIMYEGTCDFSAVIASGQTSIKDVVKEVLEAMEEKGE